MMRYLLTILLLFIATFASAQTVRQPEPVPSAAAQMFEQLASGDWIQKAEALDYLSRYDVPDVAPRIKAMLENPKAHGWLRGRALVALARIDAAGAAGLAETYSKDQTLELRAAAAEICADLPADAAAPIIERLLADKVPLVRYQALAAHARHRGAEAWKAAEAMMAKIPDDCVEPAARALARIGTEAACARLLELSRQSTSVPALLRGLDGVNNAGMLLPVYLDLIAFSKDSGVLADARRQGGRRSLGWWTPEDSGVLADAWQEMQQYKRAELVAACEHFLKSGDDKHLRAVARIVTRYLREPELGDALQAALKQTKNLATLQLGLAALSCTKADRFQKFFTAHLTHKNAQVRTIAVRCLAQCKNTNLYEALVKTLGDTDKAVRIAALEALRNAPIVQAPRERIIEYFTPSLLSKDATTRKAAIAAILPSVTTENGEAALAELRQMQDKYGMAGAEPLMRAVFRMVSKEKSAEYLEAHGYVARWHVIGEFPAGFGAMGDDVDGFTAVYPPENNVDLSEKITVAYNTQSDLRRGKTKREQEIGWVATVANGDGMLCMAKEGCLLLQLYGINGVCYAYTEITVSEKTDVRLSFLFNMNAQNRVWLNGKVILESKVDTKGTATRTAQVTLNAGKNRILVKVVLDDYIRSPTDRSSGWMAKVSTRGFALSLTDLEGKPVKWSHE